MELLTTGQMIDQLKVGEVAEDEKGFKVAIGDTGVLRVYGHGNVIDGKGPHYFISPIDKEIKWRILPKHVSFEEAMKALKDGKKAILKLDKDDKPEITIFRNWYHLSSRDEITFKDMFEGKWTIEEE